MDGTSHFRMHSRGPWLGLTSLLAWEMVGDWGMIIHPKIEESLEYITFELTINHSLSPAHLWKGKKKKDIILQSV